MATNENDRAFDRKLSPGQVSPTILLRLCPSNRRDRPTIDTDRSTIDDRRQTERTIGRLLEGSGGRKRDAAARSIHRSIEAWRRDVERPDAPDEIVRLKLARVPRGRAADRPTDRATVPPPSNFALNKLYRADSGAHRPTPEDLRRRRRRRRLFSTHSLSIRLAFGPAFFFPRLQLARFRFRARFPAARPFSPCSSNRFSSRSDTVLSMRAFLSRHAINVKF